MFSGSVEADCCCPSDFLAFQCHLLPDVVHSCLEGSSLQLPGALQLVQEWPCIQLVFQHASLSLAQDSDCLANEKHLRCRPL